MVQSEEYSGIVWTNSEIQAGRTCSGYESSNNSETAVTRAIQASYWDRREIMGKLRLFFLFRGHLHACMTRSEIIWIVLAAFGWPGIQSTRYSVLHHQQDWDKHHDNLAVRHKSSTLAVRHHHTTTESAQGNLTYAT